MPRRYVRAGRVPAARELCHEAGQAWREASLGAGAGYGPATVGAAADEEVALEQAGQGEYDVVREALIQEQEEGSGGVGARGLWRWACRQVCVGRQSVREKGRQGLKN